MQITVYSVIKFLDLNQDILVEFIIIVIDTIIRNIAIPVYAELICLQLDTLGCYTFNKTFVSFRFVSCFSRSHLG